ncbi:lipopolysaccharide transport periplasmic protein LptA [Candidatus Thiothrix sp. Deng01]|uniref:Lipopolysaccharide export system protein LptA n=1 Tax=Candidatus Thiothrix phosphatis TaxID=3112415 RepID=A0ABU6D1M4_9GAMM|nr:lipopolysaccharide transport periplasmic protein LptA [Candidatus Thiothrix sp. Deng01]MEB4592279.1 lipopolysaccharide transport periplasmic protein LptA [Candidatus Thiothrix sp. Deng01]
MSAQSTTLNKWLLCLLLAGMVPTAHALKSDVEEPVQIEADSAVFDKIAGTATYDGHVNIRQGTLQILASHIEINAPGNEIQSIIATGSPVSLQQKMDNGKQVQGKAQEVRYLVKDKRLLLDGNAELMQDKDRFVSNHIEYLPDSGQLKAGGTGKSGRVSAVFYPTNKAAK